MDKSTLGFALFGWYSERLLTSLSESDRESFFASEFANSVAAKGGINPEYLSSTEATATSMEILGITPRHGQRLFRLYGRAVPPANAELFEPFFRD